MASTPRPASGAVRAIIIDLVLVIVFVVIGRLSHDEAASPLGVLETGWPFVVALGVGWLLIGLIVGGFARPTRVWPTGVLLWLVTVVGGLGLRVATGTTAELPFIIVATLTIGFFLLGWRAVTALVRVLRPATAPPE